jgi:hypothetical protein
MVNDYRLSLLSQAEFAESGQSGHLYNEER